MKWDKERMAKAIAYQSGRTEVQQFFTTLVRLMNQDGAWLSDEAQLSYTVDHANRTFWLDNEPESERQRHYAALNAGIIKNVLGWEVKQHPLPIDERLRRSGGSGGAPAGAS